MNWPATVFLVSSLIGKRDEWCRSQTPSGAIHPLLGRERIDAMRHMGCTDETPTLLAETRWRPEQVPVRVVREEQPGLGGAMNRATRSFPLNRLSLSRQSKLVGAASAAKPWAINCSRLKPLLQACLFRLQGWEHRLRFVVSNRMHKDDE